MAISSMLPRWGGWSGVWIDPGPAADRRGNWPAAFLAGESRFELIEQDKTLGTRDMLELALQKGDTLPAFLDLALRGEPITVFGGGQTRSFRYVPDLVDGLCLLMQSEERTSTTRSR